MARYTGPVCRLCRREREKLFLKGSKCDTHCPLEKRNYPPGEHGRDRARQGSEYLTQLREKQKARRIYGVLEKQFRNMFEEASRQDGITGENLLRMLEMRLDNIAFRAGWGVSRSQARQFVLHGFVTVNGRKATIPSMRLRRGDIVALKPSARELAVVTESIASQAPHIPAWLTSIGSGFEVEVSNPPLREQIDVKVREQLIVELYSK
ncbi:MULTISPECIES: 30S ribosomal protein S4 [Acidithrix]|uniref:Small ribosomal subunit protein uS4 n=1 Tax=Acidithrix ferrooxidans TaxID=1280514 RepID=A0A0D8HLD0_9ACTN|nr:MULTISPECIES: 30S ribosomal protein S4 [Acidithrix]KJF18562.1 30S ribosomal protein S4 [Acidithrix ferrooxidans]